ncbi:DUF2169 family type VI secretion system accessory protein [Bartonella sp. HY761]|uniref:DUF2169 family type VI secretion system accessory protein n=1 Tax=Bartonella sp. HY761 TaxID=2979330 RepID=UPI0021E27621|nr:DUF2169 domain-containing protein [Bartonella sp. HY761]UXN05584.1 DUF2169 domain-containing protein [Bartonella sp. HY761]UXN08158.1 DUF2169 domain-containing protein [Bartonella sp. HY761]
MQIKNLTPFTHLRFSKSDNKGLEFGVVALKATYVFDDDSNLQISDEQEAINAEEKTFGAPAFSSLKQPTDLVGYKPSTDIIVNATAYSPKGQPTKAWNVGFELMDANGVKIQKTLRVTGPRWWIPKWKRTLTDDEKANWRDYKHLFEGWELSEPEAITSLPIRYEYAYGGSVHKRNDENDNPIIEAFEYNPVGRGFIDPEWSDYTQKIAAPQIEDPNDLINDPYKQYMPVGYGAIQRAWLPRRPLGGTFDQHWIDNIWPKWPQDHNFAYNNAASSNLWGHGFLKLPITVQCVNLHPIKSNWFFTFNDCDVHAVYHLTDETEFGGQPRLDTVQIDIEADDPFDNYAFLVWRLIYKQDETERLIMGFSDDAPNNIEMKTPHPDDCGIYSDALERPDGN